MKIRLIYIFLYIFLCIPIVSQTLNLVSNDWEPFIGEKMKNYGVVYDLVKTVLERAGYKVNITFVPWARALDGTINSRYDVLVPTWHSDERANILEYSDPYLINRVVFIAKKGHSFKYNTLNDLDGLTIGIVRDYAYGEDFLNADNYYKDVSTNLESNLKKLISNRIDMTLEDELVAQYSICHKLTTLKYCFDFLPNPLSEKTLHIVISKNNPNAKEIIAAFNTALKEIKDDGTYYKILKKHGF